MKIILSPAKQMVRDTDSLPPESSALFPEATAELLGVLRGMSYPELKKLWGCSDKLCEESIRMLEEFNPAGAQTPAILAYNGIAFKYMLPGAFSDAEFAYVREHLRILSGLYGVLRPMDAVEPYRLEMQAKLAVNGCRDLYSFWGRRLYEAVLDESRTIINLASKEYSRCIEAHLKPEDSFITCVFGEAEGERVVQKGVYAKMARGEMVRFLAENNLKNPEQLRDFDRLGYHYDAERSDARQYVFLREGKRVRSGC